MKKDIGIFSGRIFGNIIFVGGILLGLAIMFSGLSYLGVIIIIISALVGKFLLFKANRRHGHILYDGGKV